MGEWSRQTSWRQGHVLPDGAIHLLFPKARELGFDVAVVIWEGEDEQYNLFIYLLYTEQNDPKCLEKAQATAESIGELFRGRFFKAATRTWKNVELEGCIAISDQAMTYAQSFALTRWNADYISLRADPQQPVPPD